MLNHRIIEATFGAIAVIGTIISFFLVKMQMEPINAVVGICITAILILIFIIIKNTINTVKIVKREEAKPLTKMIQQAKTEIFFSGFTLTLLMSEIDTLLKKAKTGVKIKILFVDFEDEELVKACQKIGGYEYDKLSHAPYKRCRNNPNIEIRVINFFMPVDFAAVDMDKNDGYIRAHHRFSKIESKEHPNIELTRINKWYHNYYEQLKNVWDKGTPWNGN